MKNKNQLEGINSIEDMDISGKRVFLRLDLNVPLKNGKITDDTRIRAALPTIKYALDKGAKLVLASHLGRPKTEEDKIKLSLEPIAARLTELLNIEVSLIEELRSEAPKALLSGLKSNQVILLENLRFDPDEITNGTKLPHAILQYIDVYINDAFGACHRAHASIVGIPAGLAQRNKGIGFLIQTELKMLDKLISGYESPYIAILGGAKVSDKIDVIEKLVDKIDGLIIGGAMAYTFLAAKGLPTGNSLIEKDKVSFARSLFQRFEARNKKILIPEDHIVADSFNDAKTARVTTTAAIPEGTMGLDIGPKTIENYIKYIATAKTVFWNGPMGVFETEEFSQGSFAVAEALAKNEEAIKIVGGGDSAAAAKASGFADKMTYISTGGGASLEYLRGDVLPGLTALKPPKTSETDVSEGTL